MIFVSSLLSWLVARFAGPVSGLQNDNWVVSWQRFIENTIAALFGTKAAFAVTVVAPALLVALVISLIGDWFFHLIELVVSVAVLLYCCSRYDYQSLDMRYQNALSRRDAAGITSIGAELGVAVENNEINQQHDYIREKISYLGYDRWFSVITWFLLLGPAGAIFYRLVAIAAVPSPVAQVSDADLNTTDKLSTSISNSEDIQSLAVSMLGWLDWVPARVWCFIFAIAGNFGTAFSVLSERFDRAEPTATLIDRVALAADDSDTQLVKHGEFDYDAAEQQMLSLDEMNDRAMVIGLVLVCLLILIF